MPVIELGSGIDQEIQKIELKVERISTNLFKALVIIHPQMAGQIKGHIVKAYCTYARPHGLESSMVPQDFIQSRYESSITQSAERFGLRYLALDFLMQELWKHKLLVVHTPRLSSITHSDDAISYDFRISAIESPKLENWQHFPFKSPRRKLYKDLDKQVEVFIDREGELFKKKQLEVVGEGDWLELEIKLVNNDKVPLFDGLTNRYWFKFSTQYVSDPFRQAFAGKKIGDSFTIKSLQLNDGLDEFLSDRSTHLVTIISKSKGENFSVELFKSMFNLKNKVDVHKKLIEVFSFRNDISQRRSIIEEIFNLLLSRQRFEIPHHLTLRKQEDLLASVRRLPDYRVYKAHKKFEKQLETLAEKQLREEALIDSIAQQENLKITNSDLKGYLHLFNHDRLREFVYFRPAIENFDELNYPIPERILNMAVLREKTLNFIITTLSRA